jgi:hypothetical protein
LKSVELGNNQIKCAWSKSITTSKKQNTQNPK